MLQPARILIAAGSLFALAASQAAAAPQLSSPGMSCASLKEAVSHAGAAIVSYRSDRVAELRLYDRLVRDGQFCAYHEGTETAFVPTLDTPSCPLPRCVPVECGDENGR